MRQNNDSAGSASRIQFEAECESLASAKGSTYERTYLNRDHTPLNPFEAATLIEWQTQPEDRIRAMMPMALRSARAGLSIALAGHGTTRDLMQVAEAILAEKDAGAAAAFSRRFCDQPWLPLSRMQSVACRTPYTAYNFAKYVMGANVPLCQKAAASDPHYAALFVIDRRPGDDGEWAHLGVEGMDPSLWPGKCPDPGTAELLLREGYLPTDFKEVMSHWSGTREAWRDYDDLLAARKGEPVSAVASKTVRAIREANMSDAQRKAEADLDADIEAEWRRQKAKEKAAAERLQRERSVTNARHALTFAPLTLGSYLGRGQCDDVGLDLLRPLIYKALESSFGAIYLLGSRTVLAASGYTPAELVCKFVTTPKEARLAAEYAHMYDDREMQDHIVSVVAGDPVLAWEVYTWYRLGAPPVDSSGFTIDQARKVYRDLIKANQYKRLPDGSKYDYHLDPDLAGPLKAIESELRKDPDWAWLDYMRRGEALLSAWQEKNEGVETDDTYPDHILDQLGPRHPDLPSDDDKLMDIARRIPAMRTKALWERLVRYKYFGITDIRQSWVPDEFKEIWYATQRHR